MKCPVFFFLIFIYLFRLCWVFIAPCGLSLVVASGAVAAVCGLLIAVASLDAEHGRAGFNSCGTWA